MRNTVINSHRRVSHRTQDQKSGLLTAQILKTIPKTNLRARKSKRETK